MTTPFLYIPTFAPVFNGANVPNGLLYTYEAGTTNPKPTFVDPGGIQPNSNPVVLDITGAATVRLEPGAYHFVLTDPTGTTTLWDQDFYNAPYLTADDIGALIAPTVTDESAVNVVNHNSPICHVDRYGVNATPGVTSMRAAWQAAIDVAKVRGGVVRCGPGPYLIDGALDCTFPVGSQNCNFAIIGEGRFKAATNTLNATQTPTIILKHTGHAFDTTGSGGVHFENLSICTDEAIYPQTCFLLARSSSGNSRSDRIINCYVYGRFSKAILYNYGAENGVYSGNQFYNISADSDTSVFDITGFNARALTSTFTTIAVGSQSCLDHKITGGEYANLFQGSGTTADVFRFDGARSVKIIGIWIDCSAKSGTSAGRCLFYVDGRHSPAQMFTFIGINGEAAAFPALYGFLFSADAQVHSNIVVIGCSLPNTQYMVGGGTTATLTQLTWLNNTNESQGGGINFTGTLSASCLIDYTANVTGSPILTNETWNVNQGSRVAGEANYTLTDSTQAVGSKMWKLRNASGQLSVYRCDDAGTPTYTPLIMTTSGLGFNNSGAVAKPTVTGSRGGNAALASLLTALASYGLITDSSS